MVSVLVTQATNVFSFVWHNGTPANETADQRNATAAKCFTCWEPNEGVEKAFPHLATLELLSQ
jgi:hypothetical protein